jgi:hypothetical protein
MADPPPDVDPAERGDGYAGTPTWVKVFGIVVVLVLLLVGFIVFSGLGGPHGPQRHGAEGDRFSGHVGMSEQVTVLA